MIVWPKSAGNQFCSYGMAKSKSECEEILDAGGKYWLNEGERDYVLPFITVSERNENGIFETTFDSRCNPPLLGKV